MKPISYFSAILITSVSLFVSACNQSKSDGHYIAYKVVANDDEFGWLNNLNDTLNNAIKSKLDGSKFDISLRDNYATVTLVEQSKTITLAKVQDSVGYYFEYKNKTSDTETQITLTKTDKGDLVYTVDFQLRAHIPAFYPAQMGGSSYNLNYKRGRAICYLTPLK